MRHPRIAALLYAAVPVAATVAAFAAPLAGAVVVAAPAQAQQHHITTNGECNVVTWLNSPGTIKYPDCLGD